MEATGATKTIDEYIALQPDEVQVILNELCAFIKGLLPPEAKEKISYGLATFDLYGNLVHFGAFKNHVGFYPGASGVAAFQAELSKYKGAKGSVQFPLGQPLPYELIGRIVEYRIAENLETAEAKGKRKK